VLPGTGGTQRIARLVGPARAIELMTSGRTFDYDEALALGVVGQVRDEPDDASFLAAVLDYARSFTAPEKEFDKHLPAFQRLAANLRDNPNR